MLSGVEGNSPAVRPFDPNPFPDGSIRTLGEGQARNRARGQLAGGVNACDRVDHALTELQLHAEGVRTSWARPSPHLPKIADCAADDRADVAMFDIDRATEPGHVGR